MYLQQKTAFKQRGNGRDGYDGVKYIDRGEDLLLLHSFVQHKRQYNHGPKLCEKLSILHIIYIHIFRPPPYLFQKCPPLRAGIVNLKETLNMIILKKLSCGKKC